MERCCHTHMTTRYPEQGAITCWRPTYEDHDRCVWHSDHVSKSPPALEDAEPEPGERLDGADLRGIAIEDEEWLEGAVLVGATFEKANLADTSFRDDDLRDATFDGAHVKGTDFEGANLEDATFEGTKLQGASFEGAELRDVEFSGSRIDHETYFDDVVGYEERLEGADDPDERASQFDAATWVYRQIQRVSRRNALFAQTEAYFYREKDLRRRYEWREGNYFTAVRAELTRWVMGYGRNPWRVLWTSLAVVLACALAYPLVGGLKETTAQPPVEYALAFPPEASAGSVLSVLAKSLYFSVVPFATLGYGDVQPVGAAARALAGVETLVGFGLVALLISVLLRRGSWL